MDSYLLGLLTIPALALVFALVYLAIHGIFWVRDEFLTHNPKFGRHVYAYRVSSVSGHLGHELIGAVFTERRNMGPEHTYLISWDGERNATLGAKRLSGGGKFMHDHNVDWDEESLVNMDDYIPCRDGNHQLAGENRA